MQDADRGLLKGGAVTLFAVANSSCGLALFDHAIDFALRSLRGFRLFLSPLFGDVRSAQRHNRRSVVHHPVQGHVQAPAVEQRQFHVEGTAGEGLLAEWHVRPGAAGEFEPLGADLYRGAAQKALADGLAELGREGQQAEVEVRLCGGIFRRIDLDNGILVGLMDHAVLSLAAIATMEFEMCSLHLLPCGSEGMGARTLLIGSGNWDFIAPRWAIC